MSLSTLNFQWIFLMVQRERYFITFISMERWMMMNSSRMISVDDLTYSTLFSDEVFDNGEWHTYAGLETCDALKPTRHGNEHLGKSIQSATERGDSGIDNIAYLPGDNTSGTGHTQVYESSDNMLVSNSVMILHYNTTLTPSSKLYIQEQNTMTHI